VGDGEPSRARRLVDVDMKLVVIGIPVSDVDVAVDFYTAKVGFGLDHDITPAPGMRVVQMTPPGSRFAFFDDPDGNSWAVQEYKT
jgi:catechol 2,3-dioxygenase-like lactoylglutathione lyase family enzyme